MIWRGFGGTSTVEMMLVFLGIFIGIGGVLLLTLSTRKASTGLTRKGYGAGKLYVGNSAPYNGTASGNGECQRCGRTISRYYGKYCLECETKLTGSVVDKHRQNVPKPSVARIKPTFPKYQQKAKKDETRIWASSKLNRPLKGRGSEKPIVFSGNRCTHCGVMNDVDAKYCKNCGQSLNN